MSGEDQAWAVIAESGDEVTVAVEAAWVGVVYLIADSVDDPATSIDVCELTSEESRRLASMLVAAAREADRAT